LVAVKILNKSAASKDYLHKFLPREIEILQKINHANILKVHEIIDTEKLTYFMMELAQNGDLLDYINSRKALPEAEAKYLFRQMVLGIQYLHRHNLVHRDLKCENIMLSKDMNVKIGDFGFSLNLSNSPSKTPCGSYSYAAPELFKSNGDIYDSKKTDSWSLGVILYAMICGRLPFGDDSQVKTQQKQGLSFPTSRSLSSDAKELLRSILNSNVKERFDTYDMILHDWTASLPVRVPPPLASKPKYTLEGCVPSIQTSLPGRPPTPIPHPVEPGPLLAQQYVHHHRVTRNSRRAGDQIHNSYRGAATGNPNLKYT
jgi:serine kinase